MFLAAALFKLGTAAALYQKCFLPSNGELHLLEKAWRIFINKKPLLDKAGVICASFFPLPLI